MIGQTLEPPSQRVVLAAACAREDPEPEGDTYKDEDAPVFGSGSVGVGKPMLVGRAGKYRELNDGLGLCSPGRWRLDRRRYPQSALWDKVSSFIWDVTCRWATPELLEELTAGKVTALPFKEEELESARSELAALLMDGGLSVARQEGDRTQSTPNWRLFGALLLAANDPDGQGITDFVKGVPLGVGVRMPRLPAIFRRKVRWRLEEQRFSVDAPQDQPLDSVWLKNYRSVSECLPAVRKVLDDDVAAGLVEKTTRADAERRCQGNSRVASLGAQVKGLDEKGEVMVRVLHDGTHGVGVNSRIRVRDQDAGPLAPDVKRTLRAVADSGAAHTGMVVDVKGAHRLVPVREEDWGYQACSIDGDEHVYLKKVGTFGISSASYWWARAGGAWSIVAPRRGSKSTAVVVARRR